MEGAVAEETAVEGPLVEGPLAKRSVNEKRVVEQKTVNKKLELNDQQWRTCGKVHVQMVRCFYISVV